jgi:3-hydroxyacyl-CoA dehydrogenase/enoyl-CoA hydratase/carnithine racemase
MINYSVVDGLCLLGLAAPPRNVIDFPLLDALLAGLGRANTDPAVAGIVITGDAEQFSAGADMGLFRDIRSAEDAVAISRRFQEAFCQVEDSPKPTVALMAGKVLGSAVELALACRFRICAEGTRFRMPEVTLGIVPGAGGSQRLPRLIGLPAAIRMLLAAEWVTAEQALRLGLVDAVAPAASLSPLLPSERSAALSAPHAPLHAPLPAGEKCFAVAGLAQAVELLRAEPLPPKARERDEKLRDTEAATLAWREAESILARSRPELIAPQKVLAAIQAGVAESFAAGLRQEQLGFAECMATPATRNKLYLFFAARQGGKFSPPRQQTGKPSAEASVAAKAISQAAVVGIGSMGTGIVQALATAAITVLACDSNPAAVHKGLERIGASLRKRVEQGQFTPAEMEAVLNRIRPATTLEELSHAELVIEAVPEDLAAKRAVLGKLEAVCSPEALLATNTSTISLDLMAEGLKRPERLLGLHFFYPAHHMPLVEVVRRPSTDGNVLAAAVALVKRLGKTPVVVNNREGFLVNRLFIPYLQEAFWLLEEGTPAAELDETMVEFGFPMGPLAVCDMTGLDILVATSQVMCQVFPRLGGLSAVPIRLVEEGHLGQKTGAGVYCYAGGGYTSELSKAAERILAEVQRQAARPLRPATRQQIIDRLVLRMVAEATWAWSERLVERESDLDVAMVLGTGFPDFRGGVARYARQRGLAEVLARLDELAAEHGPRYMPCDSCAL